MPVSEDYDGPVSGGIVIKPDGTTEYKSYTQKEDPVLTKDEASAVVWFRNLPPNEQLREVRRMKWNLDSARADRDAFKRTIKNQDKEIMELRAKISQFTPMGGYVFPPAARDLIDFAAGHGWRTAYAWNEVLPRDDEDDQEPYARLDVLIKKDLHSFQLTWSCDRDGRGRMPRAGLARAPRRGWYDAPSLIKIKKIIEEKAETGS